MIRYLSKYVSRDALDQIYKLYVRSHLDYGDIIYHRDDPHMQMNFTQRLEQTQYSAALAVTGAWRGTSRQRLYDELGWETLYHRRWYRRLCHFFKLVRSHSPEYLFSEIPLERQVMYSLRNPRVYNENIVQTVRFSKRVHNRVPSSRHPAPVFSHIPYPAAAFLQIPIPPRQKYGTGHDLQEPIFNVGRLLA